MLGGSFFVFLAFIFSYVFPSHSFLDLNLSRNMQFMQFILIGYTTALLVEKIKLSEPVSTGPGFLAETKDRRLEITAFCLILFSLLRFTNEIAALAALSILFLLTGKKGLLSLGHWILFVIAIIGIIYEFRAHHFAKPVLLTVFAVVVLVLLIYFFILIFKKPWLKIVLMASPFLILTVNYIYYHKLHLDIERRGGGFWQLQRNWIDMQNYVRTHTPKNAYFLTPNDMEMGGFRIYSERPVLVCYRDCGIIGFDYKAALEWQKRLKDVEHFKVRIDGDISAALINAIGKYKVNYIVFMRYAGPKKNPILEPVYENEAFSLYRVKVNPV